MSQHSGYRDTAKNQHGLQIGQTGYWSVITAYGLAAAEGIKLTAEHLDVINILREDFVNFGQPVSKKQILNRLEIIFAGQGGLEFLYRLFPLDPVMQAMRIAGLSFEKETAPFISHA